MSESGAKPAEGGEREALTRLEATVGRLIDRSRQLGARSGKAEARVRDLDALLKRFTKGETDPAELQARISELETENADLRRRLVDGRDGVDRLLARLRFMEDRAQ